MIGITIWNQLALCKCKQESDNLKDEGSDQFSTLKWSYKIVKSPVLPFTAEDNKSPERRQNDSKLLQMRGLHQGNAQLQGLGQTCNQKSVATRKHFWRRRSWNSNKICSAQSKPIRTHRQISIGRRVSSDQLLVTSVQIIFCSPLLSLEPSTLFKPWCTSGEVRGSFLWVRRLSNSQSNIESALDLRTLGFSFHEK